MVNPDAGEGVAPPDSEAESFSALRDNARKMLRQDSVQEKLASIFASYLGNVQPIVIAATVQRAGVRPEGLENEICSCFHHVARGLCYMKNEPDASNEVEKGEETHLKRLLLDAYKIAIRPYLEEYNYIVRELYELSLDKDFNPDIYGKEPIKKLSRILEIKEEIKGAYRDAKCQEALGNGEECVAFFGRALNGCYELKLAIQSMMKENVYLIAHAHLERKRAEREADKEENRFNTRIAQAIAAGAAIVSLCSWLAPRPNPLYFIVVMVCLVAVVLLWYFSRKKPIKGGSSGR